MVNGRNKGARYMVDVCRLLSHWVCGTPRDAAADQLAFRPRSTSIMPIEGHWRGRGDILARPDLYFPFCIECKKHEDGDLDGLFDAPKWSVWAWWAQAKEQASAVSAVPALIFCRNRRENRILFPQLVAQLLGVVPKSGPTLEVLRSDGERLTLCLLEDLLAVPAEWLGRLREVEGPEIRMRRRDAQRVRKGHERVGGAVPL